MERTDTICRALEPSGLAYYHIMAFDTVAGKIIVEDDMPFSTWVFCLTNKCNFSQQDRSIFSQRAQLCTVIWMGMVATSIGGLKERFLLLVFIIMYQLLISVLALLHFMKQVCV